MILYKTKQSEIVRVDGGSTGQSLKKYSTSITGDGIKTVFTIEHNLDTEDILFEMNDGTEPALIDYAVVDKNNVHITFAVAPTTDEKYNIKIYGVSESDSNNGSGSNSGDNSGNDDNNGSDSDSTIDPSKIGVINDDWDYILDEINNIITLKHYTGSDTYVTVYSHYKINDKVYKTEITGKSLFKGKSYIKTITFNDDLDTSNVTDMSSMFSACYDLTVISFNNINTSNVTNMESMFEMCRNLSGIYLGAFDTSNVTNMKLMFYNCEKLTHLYLTNFDTSNVTSMKLMFSGCKVLETINVDSAKWVTTNTDTENMFLECGTGTVTYV